MRNPRRAGRSTCCPPSSTWSTACFPQSLRVRIRPAPRHRFGNARGLLATAPAMWSCTSSNSCTSLKAAPCVSVSLPACWNHRAEKLVLRRLVHTAEQPLLYKGRSQTGACRPSSSPSVALRIGPVGSRSSSRASAITYASQASTERRRLCESAPARSRRTTHAQCRALSIILQFSVQLLRAGANR